MSDHEDADAPIGYELINIGTKEDRLRHLASVIAMAAHNHPTLLDALSCAARSVYVQLLADTLGRLLQFTGEEGATQSLLLAEHVTEVAPPNLYANMMIGEAFALYESVKNGGIPPLPIVQAYRSGAN